MVCMSYKDNKIAEYAPNLIIFVRMSTGTRIFQTLVHPLQKLPLGFHYAAVRPLVWFIRSVMKYRRDVVMVNLSRSFPTRKWKEIRQISNDFYSHFGDIFAEAMWFGGCRGNSERLRSSGLYTVRNPEDLLEAYRNSPSVLVLSSHMGNWELTGGLLECLPEGHGIENDDLVVTYKRLANGFWDEFIGENRAALLPDWTGYQESGNIMRYALANRNRKKVYIFIGDQFPYKGSARHEVPDFMHQPTLSMNGGAMLAAKLHMPVFYYGMERAGKGRYEVSFTKICDDAAAMDPNAVMAQYYKLLEADIDKDPANYLWSHNRWKQ